MDRVSKSLLVFNELNFPNVCGLIKDKIGSIQTRKKEFSLAHNSFHFALELTRKTKDKFAESETLFHLAKLNQMENKQEIALTSVKESIELTETLYSDVFNSSLKRTYFSTVYNRYAVDGAYGSSATTGRLLRL